MDTSEKNIATYVLFGNEAISIYKKSINTLLDTKGIDYKIGKYISVKKFFEEKNKWEDYAEINYLEYITIKTHLEDKSQEKKSKKFSLSKLFSKVLN